MNILSIYCDFMAKTGNAVTLLESWGYSWESGRWNPSPVPDYWKAPDKEPDSILCPRCGQDDCRCVPTPVEQALCREIDKLKEQIEWTINRCNAAMQHVDPGFGGNANSSVAAVCDYVKNHHDTVQLMLKDWGNLTAYMQEHHARDHTGQAVGDVALRLIKDHADQINKWRNACQTLTDLANRLDEDNKSLRAQHALQWIKFTDRQPTEADADGEGYVIQEHNGHTFLHLWSNQAGELWHPLLKAPKPEPPADPEQEVYLAWVKRHFGTSTRRLDHADLWSCWQAAKQS